MGFEHGLKKNQILSNDEIVDLFKCGNMGGMRRSKKTNILVLVSDYTKGLYHDKWIGDIIHYTGMGKIGDQKLDFMQNKTLNESKTNGITVVLFEVFKAKEYTFVGEVELCGLPYQEKQKGEDKKLRNVYIFPLKVKNTNSTELEQEVEKEITDIEKSIEIKETEKLTIIKSRVGHGALKRKLLQKQKKCVICGLSDERFLIASHIKPWSESDHNERLDINNVLLLCPHHDAAFDKGCITFNDDGNMVIASSLDEVSRMLLNLQENKKIEMKDKKEYMKWHRENIFKLQD